MSTTPLRTTMALALAAALLLAACGDDDTGTADGDGEGGPVEIAGVIEEPDQSRDHTEDPVDYDADPPSGGDHFPTRLDCGIYDEPVPNELAVHALEHGVVWFAHDPDLSPDERDTLRALYDLDPDRVIVSPYPGLEADVVAVAWERRLVADGVDDTRLIDFLETFVNGAQSPEPRASCTGGVSADDLS